MVLPHQYGSNGGIRTEATHLLQAHASTRGAVALRDRMPRFERGEVMAPTSEYVQSRRVGDVTVTAINEGSMPSKVELTVAEEAWRQEIEADAEGTVPLDTHVLLVQTGDATILIDTGLDDPSWR